MTKTTEAVRALTDKQVDLIMDQAQVFASAWSLVGGVFDSGNALERAEQEKADLHAQLAATTSDVAQAPVAWAVYWGIGEMRPNSVHFEKQTAVQVAAQIKSNTELRPLYTAPVAPTAEQAEGVLTPAARDVLAERQRQVSAEGWTHHHDDGYKCRDLAHAAGSYAISGRNANLYPTGNPPKTWPWAASWWKNTGERNCLVKAGALILAEIERIDRLAATAPSTGEREVQS